MSSVDNEVRLVLEGEPASKANSRDFRWSYAQKRMILAKSGKAISYVNALEQQLAMIRPKLVPFEGPVSLSVMVYYASRRPDLDVSVLQDCLQGYVYKNDRQIKLLQAFWGLDKKRPRVEIVVTELESESQPEEIWYATMGEKKPPPNAGGGKDL